MLRRLRELVAPAELTLSDEPGLPSAAKEAVAFAILAHEAWHGRPGNLHQATGARHPVVLDQVAPGRSWRPGVGFCGTYQEGGVEHAVTEERNPASAEIDRLSTLQMLQIMNGEDSHVARAVAHELPNIAAAVDAIVERLQRGGRLIYAGAGTSGRLGVLDASECPPTFGIAPEMVQAVIAGGDRALREPVEEAEDSEEAGHADLALLGVTGRDAVVGITASGSTPYVLGALAEARARGSLAVGLACNREAPLADLADVLITPLVGPEVITGSTRLKAGTAQKMVLNMLSTATMIRLGKTFGNLMVDVHPASAKLRRRALRIVMAATQLPEDEAAHLLQACNGEVKTALVTNLAAVTPEEARRRLEAAGGRVRDAIRRVEG